MDFENKDKEQILRDAGNRGVVYKADNSGGGIEAHEYEKLAITVKCTQDLEKAINKLVSQMKKSTESNDRLSRKIYFLNWILVGATVIIALCTVLNLFATTN
ncbi:MAG: hypothetical protein LWX54_02195 [Deltaproteobacteria bacterium]|jgi:hypothetical protein|nr:hypothetical protein [Deltaproteobacteria bacterium]